MATDYTAKLRALQLRRDPDAFLRVQAQASSSASSLHNLTQVPTPAQAAAGNYKVGRVSIAGLNVCIENPEGTERRGVDQDGKAWCNRLWAHYGYISGTRGADGDEVDIFIGPWPEGDTAWVLNQLNADGSFDEHKVLLGFPDVAQALSAYRHSYSPGWDRFKAPVKVSLDQLAWWLKWADKSRPFSIDLVPGAMPDESESSAMDAVDISLPMVFWKPGAVPGGEESPAQVLYRLARHDGAARLLMDAVTMRDLREGFQCVAMDAIVVEAGRLKPKLESLQRLLDLAGQDIKTEALQISDLLSRGGGTHIAGLYELSDGQTITVWFHNPDSTPSRFSPADDLISWKWMLNKKDITLAVAPEGGKDLDIREVARRIMLLASKNSAAFKKANVNRSAKLEEIEGLRTTLQAKQGELASLHGQIEKAKVVQRMRQEDALAKRVPVPKQAASQRVWEDSAQQATDPAGGGATVSTWDTGKADALMAALQAAGPDTSPEAAAREFIAQHLQGRVVKTSVGDCLINAQSKGKLAFNAKRGGGFKLLVIPRIPEILIDGTALPLEPLTKDRADAMVGFVPFVHTIKVGARVIKAKLKAGSREAAPLLVYNLDAHDVALDSVAGKGRSPDLTRRYLAESGEMDMGLKGASGAILDSTDPAVNTDEDGEDGLNIEILAVWDAEGNLIEGSDTEQPNVQDPSQASLGAAAPATGQTQTTGGESAAPGVGETGAGTAVVPGAGSPAVQAAGIESTAAVGNKVRISIWDNQRRKALGQPPMIVHTGTVSKIEKWPDAEEYDITLMTDQGRSVSVGMSPDSHDREIELLGIPAAGGASADDAPATLQQGVKALESIRPFLSRNQFKTIRAFMNGEEGQFFIDKAVELAQAIKTMPGTYDQDGKGDQAVVYLHYFTGGADWWITEKDKDGSGVDQAFGLADLGEPELGYISIAEVVSAGAELDLHFEPRTLAEVKPSKDAPPLETAAQTAPSHAALTEAEVRESGKQIVQARAEVLATLAQIAAGTHPDMLSPELYDVIEKALTDFPGDAEVEAAAELAVTAMEQGNLAATASL